MKFSKIRDRIVFYHSERSEESREILRYAQDGFLCENFSQNIICCMTLYSSKRNFLYKREKYCRTASGSLSVALAISS